MAVRNERGLALARSFVPSSAIALRSMCPAACMDLSTCPQMEASPVPELLKTLRRVWSLGVNPPASQRKSSRTVQAKAIPTAVSSPWVIP